MRKSVLAVFAVLAAALCLASAASAFDNVEFLSALKDPAFKQPTGVAQQGGRVYVADPKAKAVFVLDLNSGKLLATVTGQGKDQLSGPKGVAAAADGTVYVADAGGSRIVMLDKDGGWLGSFGEPGSDPGQLSSPEGVAVGPDGRVYVADTRNGRVQVFGRNGIFMIGFAAEGGGSLSKPTRIAVDRSENIYVLDASGSRLHKFAPDGKVLQKAAVSGGGLAVDRHGWLYVVDPENGKVQEYTPAWALEGGFGTSGKGPGQFREPSDLAFDGAGGLLIADPGNKAVTRYRVENSKKKGELPVNKQTKISISGPVWTARQKIGPFVPVEGGLIGYKLDSRELVRLDDKGQVALKFGPRGKGEGQVRDPKAVDWSADNGVFVSDTGNDRIEFFGTDGKFKGVFGAKSGFFESKSKEGNVNGPEGVAMSAKNVYIADVGNRRIQAFNPKGVFLFSVGPKVGDVEFKEPAVLQWNPKGSLYVLDRGLKKVVELEANGKFVKAWGAVGEGLSDWQEPVALAFDGHSYLYVLDRAAARLRVYDTAGNWVMNCFSRGGGEKSLVEPSDIAISGKKLYISDSGSSRVLAYEVRPVLAPPAQLEASASEGEARLSWSSAAEDWVKSYHVERSSLAAGPYVEAGAPAEPKFKDTPDTFYTTYYYRVSVEAKTGDIGPASNVLAVYVPGSFNVAPVEISTVDLTYIFSANYKYYLGNPLGSLTISNNVEETFKNAKLTFFLKDFMDFPSSIEVPEIKGRSKVAVPLTGTLNNRILDVSEDTPILAELKLIYYEKGKEQSINVTKPVKVLSRNAIIWDRPERMANFITPNDDPIADFRAAALHEDPRPKFAPHNPQLSDALVLWSALSAAGLSYTPDSVRPFSSLKGSEEHPLSRVQMPRETLRRKGGECADLVALFSSVYEGAGIQTAILDYPAHLAFMINLRASDASDVGMPEGKLVKYKDSLWLPIETTMVGKPFTQAVEQGIATYRKLAESKDAHVIELADARKQFDAVSLPKEEWRAKEPDAAELAGRFEADAKKLDQTRYAMLKAYYAAQLGKNESDASAIVGLGILEAQSGSREEARKYFSKALELDSLNAAALNNMGNLSFMEKDYKAAAEAYEKAGLADPQDAGIQLNIARARAKLGDADKAKEAADRAVQLDESLGPLSKAIMESK